MSPQEALERLLRSYTRYYDLTEDPPAPFQAAAEFHSHGESYLLIKSAKLWEMDSNEFVYFAAEDALTAETVSHRIETAWDLAMPQIHPGENHRNSDVTVVFLTNSLPEDARKLVVVLTPAGAERAREYERESQEFERSALACLTQPERAELLETLDRLINHWNELEPSAGASVAEGKGE
jgi:hypothetical protein